MTTDANSGPLGGPARAWAVDTSAFDVLDESWRQEPTLNEEEGTADAGATDKADDGDVPQSDLERDAAATTASSSTLPSISHNEKDGPQSSSTNLSSEAQRERLVSSDMSWDAKQKRRSKDDGEKAPSRLRRRSSGAVTDTELLQPGPSSPSRRMPSHKLPSQSTILDEEDGGNQASSSSQLSASTKGQSHLPAMASPDHRPRSRTESLSSSSHNSETKQSDQLSTMTSDVKEKGEHQDESSSPLRERTANHSLTRNSANEEEDQFGSAMENISVSNAAAMTAVEEATFIEHSNAASPPPFMKQAWQKRDKSRMRKDIFGPSPLQALFLPPSPASKEQVSLPEEQAPEDQQTGDAGPLDEAQADEAEEAPEADVVGSESRSPELSQIIDQPSLPHSESGDPAPAEASLSIDDEASTHAKVPQASAFTFSPPVDAQNTRPPPPPPTPSASHAPLRLLHLRGRNHEVEQILNTPRSAAAAKSNDARRLVWKLVQEGGGAREKKRLRMCQPPRESPPPVHEQLASPDEADDEDDEEDANAQSRSLRAKHAQDAHDALPRFLQRVENIRISSDGLNRSASSLIDKRKGAKAPTPERSRYHDRLAPMSIQKSESPRKILRRWSAANQVDEELEEGESLSMQQEDAQREQDEDSGMPESFSVDDKVPVPIVSIAPPSSSPFRRREKLAASRPNFASLAQSTQHPGVLHIAPDAIPIEEMEALSNGRMTFDREQARWIRVRHLQRLDGTQASGGQTSGEDTNDPFRELESTATPTVHEPSQRLEVENVGMDSLLTPDEEKSLSLSGLSPLPKRAGGLAPPLSSWSPSMALGAENVNALLTPARSGPTDVNRSTPRSILKTAQSAKGKARWPSDEATPTLTRQANRKISFADGINPANSAARRRERMSELLHEMSQLALNPVDEDLRDESVKSAHVHADPLGNLTFSPASTAGTFLRTPTAKSTSFAHNSMPARSPWGLSVLRAGSRKREVGDMSHASFLTNASFNIAHDRVLELLTDVAPWTTKWHEMRSIDLRERRVESLVRLDEFLPLLEEALLDDNEIDYLTGLPGSLRRLSIVRNRLAPTAAFGHLANLESLDISNNNVDLKALRNLTRLRHLFANGNRIVSIEGLQGLSKLEKLHLRDNQISAIHIAKDQWPNLQDLVLSRNKIVTIEGLGRLKRLRCLNLDHNLLRSFDLTSPMPKLKQLRVSGNQHLRMLDVGCALNLCTLYADDCALNEVKNIGALHRLSNLSLRQQRGTQSLRWPAHEIRDVKRLFLSGNAFQAIETASDADGLPPLLSSRFTFQGRVGITQFFSLIYLELSGCQLTSLPDELAEMVPNVRHLNADYNLFEHLPKFSNLRRLKRLSLVGCRISKSRRLVESVQGCEELIFFDVRMNPCTLGLYPPIVMAAPKDEKVFNRAFLPPVPHPLFAGPILSSSKQLSAASKTKKRRQDEVSDDEEGEGEIEASASGPGEKSFFHKRHPRPPLLASSMSKANEQEPDGKADPDDLGALFAASDERFVRTLPSQFRLQRMLHRGSIAMACVNLTWLDGLLIDEEEVRQANRYFLRRSTDAGSKKAMGVISSSGEDDLEGGKRKSSGEERISSSEDYF